MEVIKYLKNFSNLEEGQTSLEKEFGIKIKRYENLFVLNYSQIDSPKTHSIVKECRGLILSNDLKILCRPFDRFFNYGEGFNTNFDFSNSVCLEKLDGSLIKIWYNPFEEKWEAGTRGTAFGEAETPSGKTFIELVEAVLEVSVNEFMGKLQTNSTFIFELCTRENRVVKIYDKPQLVLLGTRNNESGLFYSYDTMRMYVNSIFDHPNVRLPKIYSINELDKAREEVEKLTDLDEGFVFWNESDDTRVKIKSPAYVAVHHIRDNGNINPKRISELVFLNETSEYLGYFPEDKIYFNPYLQAYDNFIKDIHTKYEKIENIENQKEFALLVKDHICAGAFFSLRQGKELSEITSKMSSNKKVEVLNYYMEK